MEETQNISPKFDPSKQYKWSPDTKFILAASEYGMILNGFRAILNTTEAKNILMVLKASEILEEKLKQAVETGQAQEIKKEPTK
jgi:hypothetical protein